MSLQVHFVFKPHLTETAAELIPFLDVLQVLPLEMFAKISQGIKRVCAQFRRQILISQANETYPRPRFLVHRHLSSFQRLFIKIQLGIVFVLARWCNATTQSFRPGWVYSTLLDPTISHDGTDGRVPPTNLFLQCESRTSQDSVNQLLLCREQSTMSSFDVVLDFDASKLLLDILNGLFILLAFLNILKKSMALTLPFLINFAVKLLVRQMLRCVFKGTFELLSSVEQRTNCRIIVHQCRLFWREPLWPTIVNRTTHGTSCAHQGTLGLNASHDGLRVHRDASREVVFQERSYVGVPHHQVLHRLADVACVSH